MENLLKNLSLVFQDVYLFRDTIENNIRFANPDASHEQVVEAAKKARCHNFIMELPDGYNTMVGEAGKFSFRRRKTESFYCESVTEKCTDYSFR